MDSFAGVGHFFHLAKLHAGETVVDLGSGAGNDAFIAAKSVGPAGRVIGVDMTPEMISRARANAARVGAENVEFRLGEIEALPIERDTADVVISNCVVNLVPDKRRAFSEIHRILKPGGRFTISDVVLGSELPEAVRRNAALWAGCVAGALPKAEYLEIARQAGFEVVIEKEREIEIPSELAAEALAGTGVAPAQVRVLSMTLTGRKT